MEGHLAGENVKEEVRQLWMVVAKSLGRKQWAKETEWGLLEDVWQVAERWANKFEDEAVLAKKGWEQKLEQAALGGWEAPQMDETGCGMETDGKAARQGPEAKEVWASGGSRSSPLPLVSHLEGRPKRAAGGEAMACSRGVRSGPHQCGGGREGSAGLQGDHRDGKR